MYTRLFLLITLFSISSVVIPFKHLGNHVRLGITLFSENEYTPLDLSYRKSTFDNIQVEKALNSDSEVIIGGKFQIIASASSSIGSPKVTSQVFDRATTIRLEGTKEGWGDGRHPTTNLCLGKYCYLLSSSFSLYIFTDLSFSLIP